MTSHPLLPWLLLGWNGVTTYDVIKFHHTNVTTYAIRCFCEWNEVTNYDAIKYSLRWHRLWRHNPWRHIFNTNVTCDVTTFTMWMEWRHQIFIRPTNTYHPWRHGGVGGSVRNEITWIEGHLKVFAGNTLDWRLSKTDKTTLTDRWREKLLGGQLVQKISRLENNKMAGRRAAHNVQETYRNSDCNSLDRREWKDVSIYLKLVQQKPDMWTIDENENETLHSDDGIQVEQKWSSGLHQERETNSKMKLESFIGPGQNFVNERERERWRNKIKGTGEVPIKKKMENTCHLKVRSQNYSILKLNFNRKLYMKQRSC